MNEFLSDENITRHREYIRMQRLKYSIFESSFPELVGADFSRACRVRLKHRDRTDALSLLSNIEMHDIFFSSFSSSPYPRSKRISKQYGSESGFLNEVYGICMGAIFGFIAVYDLKGEVNIRAFERCEEALTFGRPTLAIDVCEHAYFMDYGFDKERYLIGALPYLDIGRI